MIVENALARQLDQGALSTDLSGDLVVGKSVRGEDGDLLPSGDRVHHVDGGDAGLHHLLRVDPNVKRFRCNFNQRYFFLQLLTTTVVGSRYPKSIFPKKGSRLP